MNATHLTPARGWQRINTKLKHNNCNHRGSMGLETPRVDSPIEAFVMCVFLMPTLPFKGVAKGIYAKQHSIKNYHIHKTKMLHVDIFRP
ncbi:TPA: DUF1196 domain-containing protein [Vibrio cholerae]|nr:DUF1196 domain-containing protein [Vibrio cholerae]HAS3227422.1 DUF1196 domain-containing protein [Vibrio cholerae]